MDFNERLKRRNEFDASLVYGTKKFNELTGRKEHLDYRKNNDDMWLNTDTGVIHEKYAELRNCPLCDSNNYITLFVKSGFPHVKCLNCQLVYVNPILNKNEYIKLCSAEDSWESILENEHQMKMQALEANYSLDIVELYSKKTGKLRICDVGCGPGTLLLEAKKRNYDVFGIEPNERCHKFLKQNDLNFIGDFFPLKKDINEKFDCMFLLNVLEHMRDPIQTVKNAKSLLSDKGILYISVPCIDALVNRILQKEAGVFGGHSHLQFFNHVTMTKFFEKLGIEVLEYETIITELGVIKNYLSFENPYFGDTNQSFDYLTPEMIYQYHLGRNINITGRLI